MSILPLYFRNKYPTQTQNDKFTSKAASLVENILQNNNISPWEPDGTLKFTKENIPYEALLNWLDPDFTCINVILTLTCHRFRSFDVSVVVGPPQIA